MKIIITRVFSSTLKKTSRTKTRVLDTTSKPSQRPTAKIILTGHQRPARYSRPKNTTTTNSRDAIAIQRIRRLRRYTVSSSGAWLYARRRTHQKSADAARVDAKKSSARTRASLHSWTRGHAKLAEDVRARAFSSRFARARTRFSGNTCGAMNLLGRVLRLVAAAGGYN